MSLSKLVAILLGLGVIPALAADLTVEIDGVAVDRGKVYVALYDHAEDFPVSGRRVGQAVSAKARHVTVVFKDLPPGQYAAAAFQDLNGNGKMDRNLLGVPKEPYGFSGEEKRRLRAPRFSKASIHLESDASTRIVLK
jgi:uncharacterized protein (DUF2141 family)